MRVVMIVFLIIATIFALATLVYVAVDLILERTGSLREEKNDKARRTCAEADAVSASSSTPPSSSAGKNPPQAQTKSD